MLAAFYTAPGRLDVRETERPTPGPLDAIVRVAACGVCGTDRYIFAGDYVTTMYPLIGGHETVFALQRIRVRPGSNALIYGAGTIGQLMLQLLKRGNATHVAIVDTKPEKLALARRLGVIDYAVIARDR